MEVSRARSSKPKKFGASVTADMVARDINLNGKNAIITGGNSGIGKESCRVLCKMGANVFLLCRNTEKGTAARDEIIKKIGDHFVDKIHILECDLASFESIRHCVAEFNKSSEYPLPVHILLNNAGVMACPRSITIDKFEIQFGTNHLGHFLLTNLLLPNLKLTRNARVVNVSSAAHTMSGIRFDVCGKTDIYNEMFGEWKAYSISKTANILFSNELDRRYKEYGIRSNALHPGVISTELGRHNYFANLFYTFSFFTKNVAQGAATSIYVATAPEVEGVGGKYFADCKIVSTAAHACVESDARNLWELSLKWVGLSGDETYSTTITTTTTTSSLPNDNLLLIEEDDDKEKGKEREQNEQPEKEQEKKEYKEKEQENKEEVVEQKEKEQQQEEYKEKEQQEKKEEYKEKEQENKEEKKEYKEEQQENKEEKKEYKEEQQQIKEEHKEKEQEQIKEEYKEKEENKEEKKEEYKQQEEIKEEHKQQEEKKEEHKQQEKKEEYKRQEEIKEEYKEKEQENKEEHKGKQDN